MCGIVGLYLKNPALRPHLGRLFSPMMGEMTERGPDSAGFAVYREEGGRDEAKVTVCSVAPGYDWPGLAREAGEALGADAVAEAASNHAVLRASVDAGKLRDWIEAAHPELSVTSSGSALEIYKEVGLPMDVLDRFGVSQMAGSHMIGHTRMATESAVTTAGAHPFSTGDDLCLVHNGSLSNHHRLRDWLREQQGVRFQTDNDTEVAAGYLTWRIGEGASIAEALEAGIRDLDGFYTFAVGTREGFSVLRDPIACKPAVMAENDDWVAMASEFRALACLPDVEAASVWEPEPGKVYSWGGSA